MGNFGFNWNFFVSEGFARIFLWNIWSKQFCWVQFQLNLNLTATLHRRVTLSHGLLRWSHISFNLELFVFSYLLFMWFLLLIVLLDCSAWLAFCLKNYYSTQNHCIFGHFSFFHFFIQFIYFCSFVIFHTKLDKIIKIKL